VPELVDLLDGDVGKFSLDGRVTWGCMARCLFPSNTNLEYEIYTMVFYAALMHLIFPTLPSHITK